LIHETIAFLRIDDAREAVDGPDLDDDAVVVVRRHDRRDDVVHGDNASALASSSRRFVFVRTNNDDLGNTSLV